MDERPLPLSQRSVAELARRAAGRSFTGDLVVRESDGTDHRLVFLRGHVVAVHVRGRFDPILGALLRAGALDSPRYVALLESLGRSRRRAGDLAREAGVTPAALERALREQAELRVDALLSIARDRGREAFLAPRRVSPAEVSCRLPLPTTQRRSRVRTPRSRTRGPSLRTPETGAQDRKALRRLAFALHPDRHPHLSETERAALAERLALATAAYHRG